MNNKTNKVVSMKVAPEYRNYMKIEASKMGISILKFSRIKAKEKMEIGTNGFKINF